MVTQHHHGDTVSTYYNHHSDAVFIPISRRLSNTFQKAIITSHHDNVETSGLVYCVELFVVDMEI